MLSLVGTWRLVGEEAFDAEGAPRPLIYGRAPLGSVTFTAEGRVAAVLSDGREDAPAPRGFTAFCGRYTLEDALLTLHLEAATRPGLLAAPQLRLVSRHGSRMALTAAPVEGTIRRFAWVLLGTEE